MNQWFAIAVIVVVLGTISWLAQHSQPVIPEGVSIFMRLETPDSGIRMQGKRLELSYAMAHRIPEESIKDRGRIIVRPDEKRIAHFVRIDQGEPLQSGELRLIWHRRGKKIYFARDAVRVTGGDPKEYGRARYAELKVDPVGRSAVVGLRDGNLHRVGTPFTPLGPRATDEPTPD